MRAALASLLLLFFASQTALAEDADSQAIQAVIQSQLDAFQQDDGQTAFSFAAPTIQQQFGSPDRFMTMVRRGYDPVYRPQSSSFAETEVNADRAVQKVVFVDRAGKGWMGYYFMERQSDGRWRIAGVRLEPLPDASA